MYKVPEEWKLSDFLELSNDEKLKWLYNGVKNAGGGSDLPEVTSADNGDVLTVVNGEWNKATPSGSSDAFEVKFTVEYDEEEESYIVTSDKTYSEISAAYGDGKEIYAWMYYSNTEFLTIAYNDNVGNCNFYFEDKTKIGGYKRFIITVGSDYAYATVYSELAPVYMPGTYSNGDYLDETSLELFNSAIQYESLVYMRINVSYGEYGIYIFHHNYLETGYCIAGTRDASGATVRVDTNTGEITVTPA